MRPGGDESFGHQVRGEPLAEPTRIEPARPEPEPAGVEELLLRKIFAGGVALPDLKRRIQAAFLEVKDIPWSDQGMLNGFKPTNDAAYNVIRDTAKVLNLDLKKMK